MAAIIDRSISIHDYAILVVGSNLTTTGYERGESSKYTALFLLQVLIYLLFDAFFVFLGVTLMPFLLVETVPHFVPIIIVTPPFY